MKRKTHFESSEDVAQYFASLKELTVVPKAPENLWEQLDSARRMAHQRQRLNQKSHPVPRPPESLQIEISTPARRQKVRPIKVVERIEAIPAVTVRQARAPNPRPAPISLRELL